MNAINTTELLPTMALGLDFPELREAVRRLCADFPGTYWRELEKTDSYPVEFIRALTQAGFLSALIPEEYGGSGLPLRAAAVILEEINASGCVASQGHAQMYIMGTLLRHGSEAQKKRYLPGIANGELRLQAFGVTEPTTGSDTTSLKTRAVRAGDHYEVSGQKVWTSRALHSDLMLLIARTTPLAEVQKKTDGLSVFIVDIRDSLGKGMEIRPIEAMINHGATEVFFDRLRVPAENLIGEEGKGFRYILDGMNAERILVGTEAVGDARWCLNRAVAYANERMVFGRSIGKNQGVQFPLARCHVDVEVADMMCRRAAALFEAGVDCGADANIAKLVASEAAFKAADVAMQTLGGFSYAKEYDVERKWRETRIYQIAPISTNMILSYIGQHVLGLERSFERRGTCMNQLDGTWSLVAARAWDESGKPLPAPYGQRQMGFILFENGRMLAALCNADADLEPGQRREYSSYGGTYTFDGRILEVLVDVASDASRIGGRQVRDVQLAGERMTLRPPTRQYGGDRQQRELLWQRVAGLPRRAGTDDEGSQHG